MKENSLESPNDAIKFRCPKIYVELLKELF